MLKKENDRRDAEAEAGSTGSEEVYIEQTLEDGTKVERKVDRVRV